MELTHYLRILIKHWWLITPIVLVTVVSTAIFTWRQDPTYSTTTTFIVSPSTSIFSDPRGFLSGLDVLGARGSVANTYSDIATSRRVRNDTIEALGLNPVETETIDVASKILAGTNVIYITVEGTDPSLITTFANKLGEITVMYVEKLYGVYDLKILDVAEPPVFPFKPNWKLNLALAALLSLAMGVSLAFLMEYMDDTLRIPDEISRIFQAPLIGFIPVMAKPEAEGLYMVILPRSAAAEAFRSLRTNLEFASVDQPLKTILVTSIGAGDGKSSVAINLAIVLAQSGKRVVLADADLRRPSVHRFFSIPNQKGLSDIIRGQVNFTDAIYQSQEGGVAVIPAGPLPPNPAEMLGSKKMEHILASLQESADVVILDSAPFLVADAWALSAKVDGVVLIVQLGRTTKKAAQAVMDQIQRGRVPIVGVVLNCVVNGSELDYYSGYLAGATEHDCQILDQDEVNRQHSQPKSWLGLYSRLKKTPDNGRTQSDAQLYGIQASIIERISTEYTQDIFDILSDIRQELSAPNSFPDLLQRLLRLVLDRVGGVSGSIVILDENGHVADGALAYASKVYSPLAQQLVDTVECGLAGWVIRNRELVLITSTRDDPRWLMRPWDQSKKASHSVISVALASDERVFEVITLVYPRPGMFSQNDLVLLKTIGMYISISSAVIVPSSK